MSAKRAHVVIPEDLLSEIDRLVGKRGRSRFLAEAAAAEVKRRRQLSALRKAAGSWKDEKHPELKRGAAQWVSQLRKENERRLAKVKRR
jgi:metal-responsive CopG/Arc/MetJ family transcriptional regulator